MNKNWVVFGWAVVLAALGGLYSFSCSPAPGSKSNCQIYLYIQNDSGCSVITTLDGGNPVTEYVSGNGGPYTIYTNVTTGNHTIGVAGPTKSSACNYDITGANQTVTVDRPCATTTGVDPNFNISCN